MQHLIFEVEQEIETLLSQADRGERAELLKRVAEDLRTGRQVTDLRFDRLYPPTIRDLSRIHWTPVEVAIRAAELLGVHEKTRVLDIGSGSGKFCIVNALASRGSFVGIEQRPHLVAAAGKLGQDLGAHQASFIVGNMVDLDWSFFDAFYFFNPFYENQFKEIRIDDTVSHNQAKFNRYVETVRSRLSEARPGTRVVTYHGFGGDLPSEYRPLGQERIGSGCLDLWEKK